MVNTHKLSSRYLKLSLAKIFIFERLIFHGRVLSFPVRLMSNTYFINSSTFPWGSLLVVNTFLFLGVNTVDLHEQPAKRICEARPPTPPFNLTSERNLAKEIFISTSSAST